MRKIGAKIFVNFITSLRIIGTILMPFVSTNYDARKLVIYIIFLLVTDTIDGILARRLRATTLFGALLDAFADKLLGISILLVISSHYGIMYLPIVTEFIIILVNLIGGIHGASIDSSILGKFKTFVLGVCVVVSFLVIYANDFIILFDSDTNLGSKVIDIFNYLIKNPNSIISNLAFIGFGAGLMVAFDYYLRAKKQIKINKENGIDAKKYRLKTGKELKHALFNTDFYEKTKNKSVLNRLGSEEE